MQEHGPYVIEDETAYFHRNPYSWNREASVLYLESPAGVGYSLCPNPDECHFDDYSSSDDNMMAVRNFYLKYPEFKPNDLYLGGESYTGVYCPYLAW